MLIRRALLPAILTLLHVSPTFDLLVRLPGSTDTKSLRVPAITMAQRAASASQPAPANPDDPLWTFTVPNEQAALLSMPTWAVFNTKWDWRTWLNRRLDELVEKKIPNLIVDLRGNEGGLDCGVPIIARLLTSDLSLNLPNQFVRYRSLPDSLDPYLDTWDLSFRNWADFAVPADSPALLGAPDRSFLRLTKYRSADGVFVLPMATPRYAGRVFVLINAACSSATFQFAQVCKREQLATLVGQTTGGNQRGINGSAFFFCRLPNSKIEFDIPIVASVPDTAGSPIPPDAGIEPDFPVAPSIDDIATGIDTELQAVFRLIRETR